MKNIKGLGQVIATDVLVIGGGIAGLCAAIRARESQADVLVVDKGGVGWAGQMPVTGGWIMDIRPERGEEFFKWAVKDGQYLNNQDWTYALAREVHKSLMELDTWGFPYVKREGKVVILTRMPDYSHLRFTPAKSMLKVKAAAAAKGVQILDKVYIIDLLQQDGKVVGAIGFGLIDDKTYIFNAKAVIIANGSCRYQRTKLFSVNTGEGVAMAYRAGAQLMNAEFSNTYGFEMAGIGAFERHAMYVWFENALGENIMQKYYPETLTGRKRGQEKQDFWQVTDAMAREVEAGRGPIYLDMSKLTHEEKDIAHGGGAVEMELKDLPTMQAALCMDPWKLLKEKAGIDPDKGKIEVRPMFVGGQAPIRIDLDCKTAADRLWAAGDAASLGSGWTGARASGTHPGWSIAFAVVSGFRAGKSAGEYAATGRRVGIDPGEAEGVKARMVAPLGRSGELSADDVSYQVHDAIVPIKYNFHREAGRLEEALAKVDRAKQNLAKVGAKDHHELMRYHQAESMALSAEWSLKSALMRKESRGTHQRVDFPDRDDKNWLRWIVIEEKNGVAQFSTEAVPTEKYKLKP